MTTTTQSRHSIVRRFVRVAAAPAVLVLAPAGPTTGLLVAQIPEPVPLGTPVARSADGFTNVFAVAELEDGRVLLTDSRERSVAILDFTAGTVERIGRQGEGPREYRSAYTILPQPDGSHWIYDATQFRFLVVDAAGVITGTRSFQRPSSSLSAPRGPDADGHLYIGVRRLGDEGLEREALVYRWNLETAALTHVTTLMTFAADQRTPGIIPMPVADAWSVLPDGSVARLVAEDYHIEWVGGSGPARGPIIPHPRLPVGQAERQAWIDGYYTRPGATGTVSGGGAGAGDRTPTRSPIDPRLFPAVVPPFERGYQPAAPWGEIWVKLEVMSDENRTVFDAIGREGGLARRVSVPGLARLVGFGPDAIYLVRKDALDLEWVEKYPRGG